MTEKELIARALREGWEVQAVSLFDEEAVEGCRWTGPQGQVVTVICPWDDIRSPFGDHVEGLSGEKH